MFVRKTMRGIILEKGKFDAYDPPRWTEQPLETLDDRAGSKDVLQTRRNVRKSRKNDYRGNLS